MAALKFPVTGVPSYISPSEAAWPAFASRHPESQMLGTSLWGGLGTQARSGGKEEERRREREGAPSPPGHLAGWTVCGQGYFLSGVAPLPGQGPWPFPEALPSLPPQDPRCSRRQLLCPHLNSLQRGKSLTQLRACPGIQGLAALHPLLLCPQVDKIKSAASHKQLLAVT